MRHALGIFFNVTVSSQSKPPENPVAMPSKRQKLAHIEAISETVLPIHTRRKRQRKMLFPSLSLILYLVRLIT